MIQWWAWYCTHPGQVLTSPYLSSLTWGSKNSYSFWSVIYEFHSLQGLEYCPSWKKILLLFLFYIKMLFTFHTTISWISLKNLDYKLLDLAPSQIFMRNFFVKSNRLVFCQKHIYHKTQDQLKAYVPFFHEPICQICISIYIHDARILSFNLINITNGVCGWPRSFL